MTRNLAEVIRKKLASDHELAAEVELERKQMHTEQLLAILIEQLETQADSIDPDSYLHPLCAKDTVLTAIAVAKWAARQIEGLGPSTIAAVGEEMFGDKKVWSRTKKLIGTGVYRLINGEHPHIVINETHVSGLPDGAPIEFYAVAEQNENLNRIAKGESDG